MQRDTRQSAGTSPASHAYEVGGYTNGIALGGCYVHDVPVAPTFGAALTGTNCSFHCSLNQIKFQPSDACPKNFIIFDQTDQRSKLMSHPALAHKFSHGTFKVCAVGPKEGGGIMTGNTNNHGKVSSFKEDTDEINALLNSEEDCDEDDDIISTGRTPDASFGDSFPDSIHSLQHRKLHEVKTTSTSNSIHVVASLTERKKERIKEIVDALRGILPRGAQLDNLAVLDEAINYLKSLKAELQNLREQNINI